MQDIQRTKTLLAVRPKSYTASTNGFAIDTKGSDSVRFIVTTGDTVDGNFSVPFRVTESDTSGGSYFLVVTASAVDDGTEDGVWIFDVALGGTRKRYLRVQFTPGTSALVGAIAILDGVNTTKGVLDNATEHVTP